MNYRKVKLFQNQTTKFRMYFRICKDKGFFVATAVDGNKIEFRLAFGLETYLKDFNHCRFGLKSTFEILDRLKKLDNVDQVSASVSTGTNLIVILITNFTFWRELMINL